MKKVRILAVVLAVLMLPIGLLISCETNPSDEPSDSSSFTTSSVETQEVSTTPPDNDGTRDGYLMYFSFDEADRGDLRTDLLPYATYFTTAEKEGSLYLIDDKGGVDGSGALLIQRLDAQTDAYVELTTTGMPSLSAQHTVEFDIKVSEGLLGDGINLYSRKSVNNAACSETFVRITEDGVYDGDGALLYEINGEEWLHVAIAVDDENLTYDIYVNGGKLTASTKFTNVSYPAWSEQRLTTYRISTNATTVSDVYAYIDNLCIVAGLDPKEHDEAKDDITYKDTFTQALPAFETTKEDTLALVEQHALTEKNLASTLSLYKVDRNNMAAEVPLMYDYTVESGGTYGGVFGGKVYVNRENSENYIQFVADVNLTVNVTITGSLLTGTYTIGGTAEEPEAWITLTDGALEREYYGVLEGSSINLYSDFNLTQLVGVYDLYESEIPFNNIPLVVDEENYYVYIYIDDYFGTVDFVIHTADSSLDYPDNAEYSYADGVLTITVGENAFTYNYDGTNLTAGEGEDLKTFEVYVDDSAWELGENEEYVLKWQNFATGINQLDFYADVEEGTGANWTNIRFDYYIPTNGVNFTFLVIVDTGSSAEGWSYYSATISHSTAGWYTFDKVITSMGGSRTPDMERFTGKVSITTTGWNNGPQGATDHEERVDGYAIYLSNIELYSGKSIVVQGPDEEHPDCTHEGTLVPSDDFVAPTCTDNGYYPLVCSVCGATKVDIDREMEFPLGHNYEGAETERVEPTCASAGYVYQYCVTCGERAVAEEIPALGHDYITRYDPNTREMRQTCKTCGDQSSLVLSESILTTKEKIEKLGITNAQYFIYDDNKSYSVGSPNVNPSGATDPGFITINPKYAVFAADANGMFKFTRGANLTQDPYIDFDIDNKFQNTHVIEFSLMLGEAVGGKYPKLAGNYITRPSAGMWSANLFTTNENGVLSFNMNTEYTIQLSEERVTHFAFVFTPKDNVFDVYVDGYLRFSGITMTTDSRISDFLGNDFRITYAKNVDAEGMSFYIGDMMAYEADFPVCVVGMGSSSGGSEYGGDVELIGDVTDGNVAVTDSDVALRLPGYVYTTAYVLDFTLTADSLSDGALLAGNKLDAYGFENTLDLITVRDGYIFVLDRAVCRTTDVSDGLRFTIVMDDAMNQVVVYLDGVEILGGALRYPDGYYALTDSLIQGFVFKAEAGSYNISGLDMYTGFSVKE